MHFVRAAESARHVSRGRSRPNVACQSVLVPVYRPEEQPHTRRREGASEMLSTFVLIGQFPFKVLSIV